VKMLLYFSFCSCENLSGYPYRIRINDSSFFECQLSSNPDNRIRITAFTGRRITVCKSEPFAGKVMLTFYEWEEE
jgi:hypothetical protein